VVEDAGAAEGVAARDDVRTAQQPEADRALELLLQVDGRLGLWLPHAHAQAASHLLGNPARRLLEREEIRALDALWRTGATAGNRIALPTLVRSNSYKRKGGAVAVAVALVDSHRERVGGESWFRRSRRRALRRRASGVTRSLA